VEELAVVCKLVTSVAKVTHIISDLRHG